MPTPTAGLQTHIWNNNSKSMMLLALYPVLILGIVWLCAFVIGAMGVMPPSYYAGQVTNSFAPAANFANSMIGEFWLGIIGAVALWFVIAYFFHTKMVRGLCHSRPVSRKEEPELYNLLENLSITAGMPMPKLEIIETHARNAFASGLDQKSFTVTVTRGLMNSLTKDELEAVLAHELAHIINRDVRLLIITIIFTGMIGFAAQMAWSNIRYGFIYSRGSRKNGSGAAVMLAIAAVLGLGYLVTLFTRFAISRKREYMADAGAVQLTKNPQSMMTALMRISGRARIPETTDDIAMMCIENAKPFMGMFATHPPIEKRIKALAQTTNTAVPKLSLPPARDSFGDKNKKNPWLTRNRGSRRHN